MSSDEPTALLHDLRGGALDAQRSLRAQPDATGADANALPRARVATLLLRSLLPTDRGVAKWLLEQEVAAHRAAGHGASDTLLGLVAAVARFSEPEDAVLLWRAHSATAETRNAVDVEQLGRAGIERVRAWLVRQLGEGDPSASDARAALAWLDDGRASGAFDALPAYFSWSDAVHGLVTDAPV